MTNENLAPIRISPEDMIRVQQAVGELEAVLFPLLVPLTVEQRRRYPKMGDGTEPFVEKAVEFIQHKPSYAPVYLDVEKLQDHFQAVKELSHLHRKLQIIGRLVEDGALVSGSAALKASLAYYQGVKVARKNQVIGANTVYEELKFRFQRRNRSLNEENGESSG